MYIWHWIDYNAHVIKIPSLKREKSDRLYIVRNANATEHSYIRNNKSPFDEACMNCCLY